jgi:hypothetical protein
MRLPISFELPPVSLGVGGWVGMGPWGGNSDAASGKISRISKQFQRSKQELKRPFQDIEDAKKFKTIGAYTESTDLIFKAFIKMIHLVTLSLYCKCDEKEIKDFDLI